MGRKNARESSAPESSPTVKSIHYRSINLLVNSAIAEIDTLRSDKNTPAATRLAAARTLLELAGLLGPNSRKGSGDREPHEMTDDELRRSIERRQAALADRAKPVSAPNTDDRDRQLLDEIG